MADGVLILWPKLPPISNLPIPRNEMSFQIDLDLLDKKITSISFFRLLTSGKIAEMHYRPITLPIKLEITEHVYHALAFFFYLYCNSWFSLTPICCLEPTSGPHAGDCLYPGHVRPAETRLTRARACSMIWLPVLFLYSDWIY